MFMYMFHLNQLTAVQCCPNGGHHLQRDKVRFYANRLQEKFAQENLTVNVWSVFISIETGRRVGQQF